MELKLSVVIITYNEEKWINQCIQSAKNVADEIIVLDSFSQDATVEQAKMLGARVYQQSFQGYGLQKNLANAHATHDWILSLDADEMLSEELVSELMTWKKNEPQFDAYKLPRLNNYMGQWLKRGGWYPDAKIRLFNKHKGAWKAMSVHEYWAPSSEQVKIGNFQQDMFHFTIQSFAQHLQKMERYSELSARDAVEKGKTCSWVKAHLGPWWFFINKYIIRLGFLDGYEGYLMCKMASIEKWLKYQKIRKYTTQ